MFTKLKQNWYAAQVATILNEEFNIGMPIEKLIHYVDEYRQRGYPYVYTARLLAGVLKTINEET